jgi:broad specificity phosphatase PhoE
MQMPHFVHCNRQLMPAYKNLQRVVVHRGREFHFMTYDGIRADKRRDREATPPTWFLISSGKRWPVFPEVPGESDAEVDRRLVAWLEQNVFAG